MEQEKIDEIIEKRLKNYTWGFYSKGMIRVLLQYTIKDVLKELDKTIGGE